MSLIRSLDGVHHYSFFETKKWTLSCSAWGETCKIVIHFVNNLLIQPIVAYISLKEAVSVNYYLSMSSDLMK